MDVGGEEPNPLFIKLPTESEVSDGLQRIGIMSCVSDRCLPGRCQTVKLVGRIQESQLSDFSEAVKSSYGQANPGLASQSFDIRVTGVNNSLTDASG